MAGRPRTSNSASEREMDKVEQQFEAFDSEIKSMTQDRMNAEANKPDVEPQTKLSQQEVARSKDVYLKPDKIIGCRDKFNEGFRSQYEYDKEYVQFVAENKEIIGETIEIWTRPYGGLPAEFWKVPCNKPVWGPRYLAEQIKRKFYHRLVMQPTTVTSSDHSGQYYGTMAVDTAVPRLDAHAVSQKRSVFMGANNF